MSDGIVTSKIMTFGSEIGNITAVQKSKPQRTNPQTLIIKASRARKGERSNQIKKLEFLLAGKTKQRQTKNQ